MQRFLSTLGAVNCTKTCVVNECVGLWGEALRHGCVLSQPSTQTFYLCLFPFLEVCCEVGVETVPLCMCEEKQLKMFHRFLLRDGRSVIQPKQYHLASSICGIQV